MERDIWNAGWKSIALLVCCLLLTCCSGENDPTEEVFQTSDSTEQTEDNIGAAVSKFADYPDDYFVKWAVLGKGQLPDMLMGVSEDTLEAINLKLEEDGFGFGLKMVLVDESDYELKLKEIGADILSGGPEVRKEEEKIRMPIVCHALEKGLLEPLDSRLEGSRLYDALPELCWETAQYQGSIYCVPNTYGRSRIWKLFGREDQFPVDFPERFDGNLMELEKYLSKDCKLFYQGGEFRFAEILGYEYDYSRFLMVAADGTLVNPLEETVIVEWLRAMNRWYCEGKVEVVYANQNKCSFALVMGDGSNQFEEWKECYSWKGHVYPNLKYSTGILAESDRKDEAFTLLELLHTDHSYGDLLIYGKENVDTKPQNYYFAIRNLIYGLSVGLKWGALDTELYFSDADEMKQYYDDCMMQSPAMYAEYPEKEIGSVAEVMEKYLGDNNLLLVTGDFETKLQMFKDELAQPMDELIAHFKNNTL